MQDYQGNSKKKKEEVERPPKDIQKVVTGEVKQRKKPLGTRFKEVFFGGDFGGAAKYVAADVLLPSLRDMLYDSFTKGMQQVVYGITNQRPPRGAPNMGPKFSYNRVGSSPSPNAPHTNMPGQRSHPYRPTRQETNEIILQDRAEAELVVERLVDVLDIYQVVTLGDLYDLLGLPRSHVDEKWGWTDLRRIDVRQVREGYLIDLPEVEAL